jgi:hypothetical protein
MMNAANEVNLMKFKNGVSVLQGGDDDLVCCGGEMKLLSEEKAQN